MAAKQNRQSVFAIDHRGLAALRIGLGLLVRIFDFSAHYGADGVLPPDVYFAEFEKKWHISLHLFGGDVVSILLMVIAVVFALLFTIGWRTRISNAFSWFLLISLHSRNPVVLQGGDELLRALLFWSMFLPLGARWSVDAARRPFARERTVLSMATLCLVGQLILLYGFATASKFANPVWWGEGLGVHFALGVEQFTTRIGMWLREMHGLVGSLTYVVVILQAAAPVLLLIPFRRQAIRTLLVPLMIGLHLAFALTMELGLFSLIVSAFWLTFVPGSVWDRLEERLARSSRAQALGERLQKLARRNPKDGSLPARQARAEHPVLKAVLGTLLVYLVWWNLAGVDRDIFRMPKGFESVGQTLRLEQRWKMFSNPPRWTQWFVLVGKRADGTEVDLVSGGSPNFDKPALVSATFANQRWRKYLNNLAKRRGQPHRRHFARFLCRRFNDSRPDEQKVVSAGLVVMRQVTPLPGKKRQRADRVVYPETRCLP